MSEPAAKTRLWYVAVYLRNVDTPALVLMTSRDAAVASIAYVASTWLRFPPEARPASCWIVADTQVETTVGPEGVGAQSVSRALAVFDPREIAGLQLVSRQVEAWREGA